MNVLADTLDLFNCIVVGEQKNFKGTVLDLLDRGLVLDFLPTDQQRAALMDFSKPLDMRTLFTREERELADLSYLLSKQLLHYLEVNLIGAPGLFDLEMDNGQLVTMRMVSGVSITDLEVLVRALLYSNQPVKDAAQLQRIIEHYELTFDINLVKNNEMRVILRKNSQNFLSGDDAVRWICYKATGETLLIKSKEVLAKVAAADIHPSFFEAHLVPLAQVFNRHKRIILAAKKSKGNRTAINQISRLSKTIHVPVRESIAKTFVAKALKGDAGVKEYLDMLDAVTIRDKFKYLNLLAAKKAGGSTGIFKIRNGKVWYRDGMQPYSPEAIERVEKLVLSSLGGDLESLRGKTILLDSAVEYGLPISRKQTLGRLPFGTRVACWGTEISSGMYWENAWGARDLDLSGVGLDGDRVGWGTSRGYLGNDIIFSGDIVDARNGAMEFLTSNGPDYGIVVNIFNGNPGSEMELVVGKRRETKDGRSKQWIDEPLVRERYKLESKECLLGFVKGNTFTVYTGRMGNSRVSRVNPTLQAMETDFWTVQELFNRLDINYSLAFEKGIEYDHDLSYEAFSLDKLEDLLKVTA